MERENHIKNNHLHFRTFHCLRVVVWFSFSISFQLRLSHISFDCFVDLATTTRKLKEKWMYYHITESKLLVSFSQPWSQYKQHHAFSFIHLSHLHCRFLSRLIHSNEKKNSDGNNKNTPCEAYIFSAFGTLLLSSWLQPCRRSVTTTCALALAITLYRNAFLWIPFSTFLSVDSSFTCMQQHHFFILALSTIFLSLFHNFVCLFFFHIFPFFPLWSEVILRFVVVVVVVFLFLFSFDKNK